MAADASSDRQNGFDSGFAEFVGELGIIAANTSPAPIFAYVPVLAVKGAG